MEILEPVWKGFVTGILFTLTFGAVFFSLIQTSIQRGFKKALLIASGVLLSDAIFISIAVWGSTFVSEEMNKFDFEIRCIGFIFLAFLGVRSIIKKEKELQPEKALIDKRNAIYLLKGFALNTINPMILISWLGVTTYVQSTTAFELQHIIFYFSIVLVTMFFTMMGICYFAGKLRNVLSPKNLHRLNVASGIIFIVFALVIMIPVIKNIQF